MSRAEQSRAEQSRAEQRRVFLKKVFKSLVVGLPFFFLKKPDKIPSPFQNMNIDELLKQSSSLVSLNEAEAHHSCPKGQAPWHQGYDTGDEFIEDWGCGVKPVTPWFHW